MEKYIFELICLIAIIISVIGIRYENINSDYLSIESSKNYRGIFVLFIVIHHLSFSIQNQLLLTKSFNYIGSLCVSIFFFLSGYGLMISLLNKKGYYKHFFKNRILKVLIPFLVVILAYYGFYKILGKGISLVQIFVSLFKNESIVLYSWYIVEQLLFYIVFYISMLLFKNNIKKILIFNFVIVCSIITIFAINNYDDIWYINSLLFFVGLVYGNYNQTIERIVNHNYMKSLLLFFFVFIFTIICNIYISSIFLIKILRNVSFVFIFLFLSIRFNFGNKVTKFLGEISYELYLTHGLVYVIVSNYLNISINTMIILLISIIISVMIHHLIYNKKCNENKEKN